jgi:hypothetical protein
LTPQGQEAAQQLPGIGAAVLNEQLRGFSDADLATLIELLSRFIANGIDSGTNTGCGLRAEAEPPDDATPDDSSSDNGGH